MKLTERILLYFILPTVAILLYPPGVLANAWGLILIVVLVFILFGFILWKRQSLIMLTFCIFLQGMNIITRIMMFFSHSFSESGATDVLYLITNLISIGLSLFILLRYDSNEFRLLVQQKTSS